MGLYRSADRASPASEGTSMVALTITEADSRPLVEQIVAGIKRQIDDLNLRPGAKLPSIRKLAEAHQISRFTVVEAYDRLVAMGYLQSRRGAGFFAAPVRNGSPADATIAGQQANEELVWLIRRLLDAKEDT